MSFIKIDPRIGCCGPYLQLTFTPFYENKLKSFYVFAPHKRFLIFNALFFYEQTAQNNARKITEVESVMRLSRSGK